MPETGPPEPAGDARRVDPAYDDDGDVGVAYLDDDPLEAYLSSHDGASSQSSYHTAAPSTQDSLSNAPVDSRPPPPYEPTLDSFANLRLSDPIPRGTSAMSNHRLDLAHEAGASFFSQSQHWSADSHDSPASGPPGGSDQSNRNSYGSDGQGPARAVYNDPNHYPGRGAYDPRTGPGTYPQGGFPQQPQHDPRYGYAPPQMHSAPPVGFHNPLYAAASDVLGMGPPPQPAIQSAPNLHTSTSGYPAGLGQYYPSGSATSVTSVTSTPYLPTHPHPGAYPERATSPFTRGSPMDSGASFVSTEEPEIAPRPSLQRSGTTASVSLRTHKSKAIDLSAPPYTKEYIDQYRIRIKDDPDPEAHFLYAKYLIDAARHIGADAKDHKSLRRFRDSLIQEALKVIRKLATQGQPYDEAQFFLANCHGTGMLGLPVDHERAYHLYLQAAKQNHPAASYRVAVCNEIGAGTRREPMRAAAFYRKSASLGDTAAMYKLGVVLLRGSLGEQANPREAVGWLRRAAEQADEENPHALFELALLYENPNSQIVPYEPAYAKELYTRAGHLGYTHAQYKLGQCYEYGALTCPVDPRRSIAWYTKAAEKGHSEAELALSGWYLTGSEGVLKQSDSEAYLWARRAANKGLSKAEYAVGYYAEVGIGVKQDIEFAKRWYMRAAAQGNKRAMNRLTEMKRSGNKRMNTARPTRQEAKDECIIA